MAERLRGRKAVAQRRRRLDAEPLCRKCNERGIVRAATVPDHIQPLALGGDDSDDNVQCLCEDCHADKTATEAAHLFAASNHPDWLRPSAIPLTIVAGPPASGKTTYVAERAKPDDLVICLDTIMQTLRPGFRHWDGGLDSSLLNRAVRVRNEQLGSLSRRQHGRVWFIVSAPSEAERQWWHGKLGGELVLLHPGAAECKRRALARGTPLAAKGVDDWERKAREPWAPRQRRQPKQQIGADGWPTEAQPSAASPRS